MFVARVSARYIGLAGGLQPTECSYGRPNINSQPYFKYDFTVAACTVWCIAACTFIFSSLKNCGLTDSDIPELVDCLDRVGRENIEVL